ncbi:ATP-binding cassette domain-containing protein [bacterium]|nr:ATP-binding cassette domain-containing protein [bacterium]
MSSARALAIKNLRVSYERRGQIVRAVRGVDLGVARGETFGLIGESGSGKSSIAKALMGLAPASFDTATLFGEPWPATRAEWKIARRRMQIVFQDAGSALSPRMRAGDAIAEPLVIHGIATRAERADTVTRLLAEVGLSPDLARRYPHELSGGQRQRVMIARALALDPELLIADEPVASLDVSIQAQVLELLDRLRATRHLSMLFITHDIRVVGALCTRVAVMREGEIVETGETRAVLSTPTHTYARTLIESVPRLDVGGHCVDNPDAGGPSCH